MSDENRSSRPVSAQLIPVRTDPAKTLSLGNLPTASQRSLKDRDPTTLDERLVLLSEPDSPRAESFRALRDNLVENSLPRIIAVSSASPNEGKSECAANLALALAEEPKTLVLLIDANFFGPVQHELFLPDMTANELAAEPANPQLAPYRIADVLPGLHVAVILADPGKPSPGFNRRRFDAAFARLSSVAYDYIVIDAPALEGAASIAIVGAAEGTILTVRAGVTTGQALRRASQRIPKGRGLGVTLMDDVTPAS